MTVEQEQGVMNTAMEIKDVPTRNAFIGLFGLIKEQQEQINDLQKATHGENVFHGEEVRARQERLK